MRGIAANGDGSWLKPVRGWKGSATLVAEVAAERGGRAPKEPVAPGAAEPYSAANSPGVGLGDARAPPA